MFGGGLLLLAVSVSVYFWFRQEDEAYRLVTVEPPSFNFGEVAQGQHLTHAFQFRNDLKYPIKIVNIHSTCGCTTAGGVVGKVVEPGDSLEVPVTLNTGDSDGRRSGTITLFYRGPGQPIPAYKSVLVESQVMADYWVRPLVVDFGRIDDVQPVTRTVRLRPNRVTDIQIIKVETTHSALSARQIEAPAGTNELHVELTFSPTSLWRSGSVSSVVCLHTTSTHVPTTNVLVRAEFVAPVEVEPAAIVIGADVVGRVEREIQVSAHTVVRITEATCPHPGVRLLPSTDAAREHRIRVIFPDVEGSTGLNTEVRLAIEAATAGGVAETRALVVPMHRLPHNERITP